MKIAFRDSPAKRRKKKKEHQQQQKKKIRVFCYWLY